MERHGHRAPAAVEVERREQRKQENVTGRVDDRDGAGQAPARLDRGLEDEGPEHERRGDGDDRHVDEVAPVAIVRARAEHQTQTDRKQRVSGDVEQVCDRGIRSVPGEVEHGPDEVGDCPHRLAGCDEGPGGTERVRCRQRAHGEGGRGREPDGEGEDQPDDGVSRQQVIGEHEESAGTQKGRR